jgi:hypothetical protein
MKHGNGMYSWMEPDEESGEAKKVASYEGKYADGKKNGLGKMTFPNGDVYFGEWRDNKVWERRAPFSAALVVPQHLSFTVCCWQIEGEGTYTYVKTKDVYSGSWLAGVKSGNGCYEYGGDQSKLNGAWDKGNFVSGEWIMEGAAVYKGSFVNGAPTGPGSFCFASGATQAGEYVSKPVSEDDDPTDAPRAPPVWSGNAVFSTVTF